MRLAKSSSPSALEQSTQQGNRIDLRILAPCRASALPSHLSSSISCFHEFLGHNRDTKHSHIKTPQWLIPFCFCLNICILGDTFHEVPVKTLGRGHTGQGFRKGQPEQLGPKGKKTCILHGTCHSICFSRHSKVLAPSPKKMRACFIQCEQNTKKKYCIYHHNPRTAPFSKHLNQIAVVP